MAGDGPLAAVCEVPDLISESLGCNAYRVFALSSLKPCLLKECLDLEGPSSFWGVKFKSTIVLPKSDFEAVHTPEQIVCVLFYFGLK